MHTLDTIMSKLANLRVHVAPVGFEIDRIVIPAKSMKADKVWLLIHDNPSEDKAGPFIEKVKKQLKMEKIQFDIARHDRKDLFKIIKSVKEIINSENQNSIYVNLSSGSKIQSIGCMMSCMMFHGKTNVVPFYAEAESYPGFKGEQQSTGVKEIIQIPSYDIQIPEERHIKALQIIKENGGKLTKKQMAELADKHKIITVDARKENYSQARFASLDKNIIYPLLVHWKFIEEEKIGRTRWIKLTSEGNNASEFLI